MKKTMIVLVLLAVLALVLIAGYGKQYTLSKPELEPQPRACIAGFPNLQDPMILKTGFLADFGNGNFCCCSSLNISSTDCLCKGELRIGE